MVAVFLKIIPLIILVFLGFVLQKISKTIDIKVLGKLSLYILTPTVMFLGAYNTPIEFQYLIIPIVILCLVTFITVLLIFILQKFFPKITYAPIAFV